MLLTWKYLLTTLISVNGYELAVDPSFLGSVSGVSLEVFLSIPPGRPDFKLQTLLEAFKWLEK